jgi:polyphosphate kinase
MTLIVRREGDQLRRYAHIGTGNYHAATARLYEDIGIFTADEEITADVADLFNYITGFGRPQEFRKLLVAPFTLRSGLVDEIRRVAAAATEGKHARIRLKLNHLVDPGIVEELYAASRAGAKVDVVARSTCALRPGVEGLSENIHVRSIVGRFLEHSRVYSFEADERIATYIGSPDLMQRNLDHRIEVLVPVENARARAEINAILDSALADDLNAWVLGPSGEWERVQPTKPAKPHSHHETMMRRSLKRARRGARERRAG